MEAVDKTNLGAGDRKAYTQPTLRVYGDIEALTKTTNNVGSNSDTRGDNNMDSRTH